MVSPSMTESKPKKPTIRRARKPNISSARKKQDNGRNVEVAMRTFEENIRGKNNNTGEKNPIIGEIMYTFKDKNVPPSDNTSGIESALEVVREFVNVCTVSVTARLVTSDENSTNAPVKNRTAATKPRKKPAAKPKHIQPQCPDEPEHVEPPFEPLIELNLEPQHNRSVPVEPQLTQPKPVQFSEPKPAEVKDSLPKPSTLQSTQVAPTEAQHTQQKSNESKISKKVVPFKVPRTLKKVESNQISSDTKISPVSSCISEPVCVDVDVSELENLSGDKEAVPLKSLEMTEPLEIDLLSAQPRKKRVSPYSQYKKAYGLKYNVQGNVQGDMINKKEMTMHDLIFYNPTNNPMSNSQEPVKKGPCLKEEANDLVCTKLEEEMVDDVDEVDSELPVPQLKLNADGQIILDPKSLVVQTSAEKSLKALENSSIIEEDGQTVNRFSKAKKKYHYWTPLETLRFYRALNTIGTDFSLMQTLFPNRTRYDLKKKFKKEERTNRELIDKALAAAAEFDVDMLEEDIKRDAERAEMQRQAKEELARKKKEEKEALKKKRKSTKSKPIKNLLPGDTGTFENRQSTKAWKRPTEKVKTARRRKKKSPIDDSSDEEEEPQFDSLYPSDDDQILSQTDHTYSRISERSCKRIKYSDDGESDDEFGYEVRPTFETVKCESGKDTSLISHAVLYGSEHIGINGSFENEISDRSITLDENESSGSNNKNRNEISNNGLALYEDEYDDNSRNENESCNNSIGFEFVDTNSESQSVSKSNCSFVIPCGDEILCLKNPSKSGIEITKSVALFGNELVGVNNESESESETRNEEKENEDQNVTDTIILNEYIIVSENVDENQSKSSHS